MSDIGRALAKPPGSIHGVLTANGGYVPAERSRSPRVLILLEREEISRGLAAGDSVRQIAARLGRAPSTLSREIGRNGGRDRYRAASADMTAWDRARRPKPCRLATHMRLQQLVANKLAADWSPQQISGWLKSQFPTDHAYRVSHETIYRSLFIQARGVLKKELITHLRSGHRMRRSKSAKPSGRQGQIKDAVSISERPAEVADRAIPGHWEGDLITGRGNTHIATLVERQSRFTMLCKVDGKDTTNVIASLIHNIRKLPEQLRLSLTWDRGTELADHAKLTVATNIAVYFCDPKSPWQRGSNENTNGLLRQYFPKGTDLSVHSQQDLNQIAVKLNTRPRKTLNYTTPADKLTRIVAPTP